MVLFPVWIQPTPPLRRNVQLERETLERKAKEMLEKAKKEKRDIEKRAEEAIEKVK